MQGHFHAHITVAVRYGHVRYEHISMPIVHGWKTTIIVLNKDNREQLDVMITRHYMVGGNKFPTVESVMRDLMNAELLLCEGGCSVLRIKLEHEDLPTLPVSRKNYREAHMKVMIPEGKVGEFINVEGWVRSRNPMQKSEEGFEVWFFNNRWYEGEVEDIDKQISKEVLEMKLINPSCKVLETKVESTVYDTNQKLDSWWA